MPTQDTTSAIDGTTDAHLVIEMLSQPRYLSGARDLVAAVSKRLGFTDHDCGQIALAVDEALCNVIRHGYDRRETEKIWLSIWPASEGDRSGVRILIEDEAEQVDPEDIKSRDLSEIRPGGLGVYIIREVMDEARFERRPHSPVGMRLDMTKWARPHSDTPANTDEGNEPDA
ncbi:MAG: ATP-binding protein [Planctomycetota bacterium]